MKRTFSFRHLLNEFTITFFVSFLGKSEVLDFNVKPDLVSLLYCGENNNLTWILHLRWVITTDDL